MHNGEVRGRGRIRSQSGKNPEEGYVKAVKKDRSALTLIVGVISTIIQTQTQDDPRIKFVR